MARQLKRLWQFLRLSNLAQRFRGVPHVAQMEAAECGVASLAMVMGYHGAAYTLSELRNVCTVGRDGISAATIVRAAKALGLLTRAVRVEPAALSKLPLPAIAHWEFNHFVVIAGVRKSGVAIVDPALGKRFIPWDAFSRAFTGILLTFAPGPAFRPRKTRSQSLRRVIATLHALRGASAQLLTAVLVLEVLGVLLPTANQLLIDHVLIPHRQSWAWPVVVAAVGCSLAVVAGTALRDRVLRRMHFAADLELAHAFTSRLLALPLAFFELRSAGDLMQRVDAQAAVRELVLKGLTGLLDALLLLGYAALVLAYDLRVGGAIVALSLVRAAIVLSSRRRVALATAEQLAAQGREAQIMVEALAAPELVRAFGAEDLLEERHDQRLVSRLNAELRQRSFSERAQQLGDVLDGFAHAAVIWLGGSEVLDDQMTLGVFAGLLTLQGLFQKPLHSLLDCVAIVARARAVLSRLDDVFDELQVPDGRHRLPDVQGRITFENVSFGYAGQKQPLCEGLNLSVAPGEKIALVGRSGQGKSTLLRLAAGLLTPTSGRILLDDVDLRDLARADFTRHVGVVLQDPYFVDDTLHANLTLGTPDAEEAAVHRAARLACIDTLATRLPDGYETPLGKNGARFSGGERQRLALARALVRSPRVLLLDEATSALDLATEHAVHANLGTLHCTRIVVAHRLETVRDADRILVVDGGRVVQEGSYAALAREPGLFAEFLESTRARQA